MRLASPVVDTRSVSQTDIVEVVRDVLDALAWGDGERLIEFTDPEVEWQSCFVRPGANITAMRGSAGM